MPCSTCGAAFKNACGRGAHCVFDFHIDQPPKDSSKRALPISTRAPNSSNYDYSMPNDAFGALALGVILVAAGAVVVVSYGVHYAHKGIGFVLDKATGKENGTYTKAFASAAAFGILGFGAYAYTHPTQFSMDMAQISYGIKTTLGLEADYKIGVQFYLRRGEDHPVISFLDKDGRAYRAGMRAGQYIIAVNGEVISGSEVRTGEMLAAALNDPDEAKTRVTVGSGRSVFGSYRHYDTYTFINPQTARRLARLDAQAADAAPAQQTP